MAKVQMPAKFNVGDITWGLPDARINTVPVQIFYANRNSGVLRPNTLPLPDGVDAWRRATFRGVEVHAAKVDNAIYMVADTPVFGYALFKFVSTNDDSTTYKAPTKDAVRPISNERKEIIMDGMNPLSQLAQKYQRQQSTMDVNPMNLGGQPAVMTPVSGEGIGHGINITTLKSELRTRAYIAGYVMGNAPQLTMSLSRKKNKDNTTTANIMAKESKPSRMLAVLMNLPANCVQRNGGLADPGDISSGAVDYATTDPKEELKMFFTVPATIAYLSAMDNSIPEYAPNVTNLKRQWTAEEILSEAEGVSYVQLRPVQNNSQTASADDRFNFRLKSTSPRRSLFTQNNIVCMRALEHVSVKVNSDKDVYEINKIAFGSWQYRKKKTETMNALQRAMDDCPTQIWTQKYTIDGEEVEGIGSVFFMPQGQSGKNAAGELVTSKPLVYTPWWQTGDKKSPIPSTVTQIVKRTERKATEDKGAAMVTSPVYLAKDPDNKLFAPYQRFINFILEQGYMTRDQLYSMGTRASKSRSKSRTLTPGERQSLEFFIQKSETIADIQAVQHEASDRAVIRAQKASMTARR